MSGIGRGIRPRNPDGDQGMWGEEAGGRGCGAFVSGAQAGPRRQAFVVGVIRRVSLPFMGTPPPIELGSLGMADSLILMVLALVVFGPRRLPQIGRQIGKLMFEFRKASNDFKFQMEEELRNAEDADRRKKEEAERQKLLAAGQTPPPPQPFTGGYMNAPAEEPKETPGESEGLRIMP